MELNIETLVKCLKVNQTSNEELKENAKLLGQFKVIQNYASLMFQIACSSQENFPLEIKLNAAIQLQNFILENWRYTNDAEKNKKIIFNNIPPIIISPEEKDYLKKNILDGVQYCIMTDNIKIMKQLTQCVKRIALYDFETNWNEIFNNKVLECLKSNDQKAVYAGIVLFYQLSKVYEHERDSKKAKFNALFTLANEYFLFILSQCSNPNNETQALFIAKILKIYLKNFNEQLSETMSNLTYLDKWIEYIIFYIQVPIDISLPKIKQVPFWKLKKVSYNLILSINLKQTPKKILPTTKDFEKYFYETFTLKFFNSIKTIYINIAECSKYIDDSCLCIIYQLFSSMIKNKHYVSEVLAIFMEDYRLKIIYDCLLTKDDIELWINRPKEYIINAMNDGFNSQTKRYCAFQLVNAILQYIPSQHPDHPSHKTPAVFQPFYEFLLTFLQTNQIEANKEIENIKADTQINESNINEYIYNNLDKIKHHLIKESILYLIKSVSSILIKKAPKTIDSLIELFIIPEFESPIGILRECGCTFIELFREHQIASNKLIIDITTKLCRLLEKEKHLPIRVMSALALPEMMKYPLVQNLLKGNIKILLAIYLKLISEVDISEMIECLQELFKYFTSEIREYIVQLCACLTNHFINLAKRLINKEEEEDNKNDVSLVLNQIIETVIDIVKIYVNDTPIYSKIDINISIIVSFCFRCEFWQSIENGFDLIFELVQNANKIPEKIWTFYNKLIESIIGKEESNQKSEDDSLNVGQYYESANQISKILSLYILKDLDTLLTGVDQANKSFLSETMRYINTLIEVSEDNGSYGKVKGAFEIVRMILEVGRGRVDKILGMILEMIIKQIEKENESQTYKLLLCQLISSSTLNNPIFTVQYLHERNLLGRILSFWITNVNKIDSKQDTRLNLMGLCSLISIVPISNNQLLLDSTKVVIETILMLTEKAAKITLEEEKEKIELKKEREMLLNKISNEDNECLDENSKVDNLQKFIEEHTSTKKDEDALDEINDYSFDDCEDWFEEEELTEIDKQNEILCVKDMFNLLSTKYTAYFEHITKLIGENNLIVLQKIIISEETRIQKVKQIQDILHDNSNSNQK